MRHQGFTLIEMMVTVSILAILLGVAVPSFQSFVANQKVKSASYDLSMALVAARSEAVKRNADITIAPETVDDWVSGWTVKWGATTLLKQQALTGVTITKGPSTIVYKASGRPTAGSNFEIHGSSAIRCVKVDTSGIPSTQSVACP